MSVTAFFPLNRCNDTLVEIEYYYNFEKGDNETPESVEVEIYNIWCSLDILEVLENYTVSELKDELETKIIDYECNKDSTEN